MTQPRSILIHDYAGHPFQVELSRALARRGHRVAHAYFAADTGPKGRFSLLEGDDGDRLSFVPVGADLEYSKTNFLKRRAGDLQYGGLTADLVARMRPDLVISGNTPSEAQEKLVAACRSAGIPFVYWCQDFYSIAASRLLAQKLPGPGHLIGAYYRFLERRQMHRAAHVIHITERFLDQTDRWGIARAKTSVIPNWGAIDEIPVMDRDTPWAAAQGLGQGARFLYSGTLALKHNPALLAGLAREVADRGQVVVVAAGVGADALAEQADGLPALKLLPLQPFEVFPEVLGAADVLLAVIEREAGTFSVPSKILSYLCSGRPIVLAAPAENLAAEILVATGAGTVVAPEDAEGFAKAAQAYADDPEKAAAAGRAGRAYAEEHFAITNVADRFEGLIDQVMAGQVTAGVS